MLFFLIPLRPQAAEAEERASACSRESQQHVGCPCCLTLRLPTWHFMKLKKNLDVRILLTERQDTEG